MRGATTTVAVKERSPLTPAIAALAVAGVAASLALRGDERAPAAPAGPEHVVREYFQAFRSRDCEAAVDLVDTDGRPGEPDRGSVVDACELAHDAEPAVERTELLSADLIGRDGDRATVRTEIREGDQLVPSEPDDVPLVRIDGQWRVDLGEAVAGESPAGSSGAPPAPERAGGGVDLPGAGTVAPAGGPSASPPAGGGTGGSAGSGAATPTSTAAPSGTPAAGQGNGQGIGGGDGNGTGGGQGNGNATGVAGG